MEKILLLPILLGFFITIFAVPLWIRRAKKVGIVGKDVHKENGEKLAEAGGITVLFGFLIGTLSYVAISTFYFKSADNFVGIFASLCVILIVALIGFIDDILGWRIGLNWKSRIVLLIFASIPLVVINAGESSMMGFEFGLLYPFLFVPLGIVATSATFNFLAGYNGLETSQGIILLSALALVTWLNGSAWLSMINLVMVASLCALYFYNRFPAKIFPGNVLTYTIGPLIAITAILGNIEKIALFFFIPYILEVGLKVRGKIKKQSFARVCEDGGLENRYEKFYGLEHIAVHLLNKFKKNSRAKEYEVVYLINGFQILVILVGLLLFGSTIF